MCTLLRRVRDLEAQGQLVARLRADNDDLARRLERATKAACDQYNRAAEAAEAQSERDARRATAEHRDRLLETVRELRADVERLKAEAENAVRVAFERGRHLAELLAEREEFRRAIRESAAPPKPYIA